MSKRISDLRVVTTSALVSLSDVALNMTVAIITGSAVMMSQALQGFSDLVTEGILFFGVRRSKRMADRKFQFGYGREVFFWVLIAGIIMFAGTGAASVFVGYEQIIRPGHIENVWVALCMLIIGFLTNSYSFRLSLGRLRQRSHHGGILRHLLSSSIVETKATFIIDFLGTASAVIGFIALFIAVITGNERFDGAGSLLIGLSMMVSAFLLMRDVRDLIIGRAVDVRTSNEIIAAAKTVRGVNDVLDLRTMYLGSERLLVILEVHIEDDHSTDEIERITDQIKETVRRYVPIIEHIQVEIETPES